MTRPQHVEQEPILNRHFQMVAYLTAAAALVAAVSGLIARSRIYGAETQLLEDAALAQDIVTAAIAVPILLFALRLAADGSGRAHLVFLGVLSFLAYNYAIYCFSITFGPLFLPWTALLGASSFLLAHGLWEANVHRLDRCVRPRISGTIVLCGVAALFSALWLSEIVSDLRQGSGSTSAAHWLIPTNPVHVLDLAFFLPAAFLAGWCLRMQRPWALVLAPVMLTFFILTSVPILVTPVVAVVREHSAEWGVIAPVGLVAILSLTALGRVLEWRK